jgi:hypothetical protein
VSWVNGSSGVANTGGGGGSAYNGGGSTLVGGSGGSGIVILRYLAAYPPALSTTGNPSVSVANGYRTYVYSGSGSITF